MEKRKLDSRRLQSLLREFDYLREAGVISTSDYDAIMAQYETPSGDSWNWGTLVWATFTTLTVLLLGLAIFLVIGHNWDYLAPTPKTVIVLGAFLVVSFFAFFARIREWRVVSEGAFFGGAILYGVGIAQIGQIFNIESYDPLGIWFWALGVWLTAFLMKSDLLHVMATVLLLIWTGMTTSYPEVGPLIFRDLCPTLPNIAWTLPILAGFGFWRNWKRNRPVACVAYSIALLFWGILLPIATFLDDSVNSAFIYLASLGGLVVLWSGLLGSRRNLVIQREVVRTFLFCLGLFLMATSLLTLSFYNLYTFCNGGCSTSYRCEKMTISLIFRVVFLAFYAYLLFRYFKPVPFEFLRRVVKKGADLRKEPEGGTEKEKCRPDQSLKTASKKDRWINGIWPPLVGIGFAGFLLLEFYCCYSISCDKFFFALFMTIVANLSVIALTIWLMTRQGRFRSLAFWSGFVYFILWTFFRYLDLFGDFGGMLGAAAFFLLLAVVVFVGGWGWSRRIRRESSLMEDRNADENEAGPVEISPAWFSEKTARILLITVILFEFGLLASMILSRTIPFIGAQLITVETEPVDPRDLFRGDYVILGYPFGNPENSDHSAVMKDETNGSYRQGWGRTVYVTMTRDEKTGIWQGETLTYRKPSEGVFLKGIVKNSWRLAFGISTFYVPEGKGREIEKAMRSGGENPSNVYVDLWVTRNGNARVKSVRIE